MAEIKIQPARKWRESKAMEELRQCVAEGFTGNLTFDFSEGMALLCRKTAVKRFPKEQLDGRARPE